MKKTYGDVMDKDDVIRGFKQDLSDTISDVCIASCQWDGIEKSFHLRIQRSMKDEIERTLIKNIKERLKLPA